MKPAVTIGHYHICPMSDPGPKPHVGGPVTGNGATSVYIEGRLAAVRGCSLQCQSPKTDRAQGGSSSVFIENKPAIRLGDATEHGGVIVEGAATVFIG